MKAYSIFDDFGEAPAQTLREAGVELTVHPLGVPRPSEAEMKRILEAYDCVILGTSQKLSEDMFANVSSPRIIATASVGLDHIKVPPEKKGLVTIINTPKANAQSVAEYTIGCALSCCKRLAEGRLLYLEGRDNKALRQKPEDLLGKTLGVVGAGNISRKIIEYGSILGMDILCWTAHPNHHEDLTQQGVQFSELDALLARADVISVNLPNNEGTRGLISRERIAAMKDTAIFVSVSRRATVDAQALFERAAVCPSFYVCLDLDVDADLAAAIPDIPNILVTPHIAGGTVSTRKRMFMELAMSIFDLVRKI